MLLFLPRLCPTLAVLETGLSDTEQTSQINRLIQAGSSSHAGMADPKLVTGDRE